MKKLLPFLDDVFFLLGAALITIGTWKIWPPATWFVGGGFCLLLSFLIGRAKADR